MTNKSRAYDAIIEFIFRSHFREGITHFEFGREEIQTAAASQGVPVPSNVGDVLYTYRYRRNLPETIRLIAPQGMEWNIYSTGRGKYRFQLRPIFDLVPNANYAASKLLDATPEIIRRYAQSDEQALLALLRYNRVIDLFTGLVCYSLQSHLRTTVNAIGQVETDELYVGVDKRGGQYIIPVQAKGGTDRLGRIQIEQDIAMCREKFPTLVCKPIAAQFLRTQDRLDQVIALFELEEGEEGLKIAAERHYRLVRSDELSDEELLRYRQRVAD